MPQVGLTKQTYNHYCSFASYCKWYLNPNFKAIMLVAESFISTNQASNIDFKPFTDLTIMIKNHMLKLTTFYKLNCGCLFVLRQIKVKPFSVKHNDFKFCESEY